MNEIVQPGTLRQSYNIKPGDDFFGRFIMGHGGIRSCVYRNDDKLAYDNSYISVFQNLVEMKMVKEKCCLLIDEHKERINIAKDGKYHGSQIDINEPIDDDLNLLFKDFFIRGIMATYCLISHVNFIGFNINFLFSDDDKKFMQGLKKFPLEEGDERFKFLNNFIKNHKTTWYSAFKEIRRKIEHEGWSLPALKYHIDSESKVQVLFPKVEGFTIEELMDVCWENIMNLCEELIVFMLSLKLKGDMVIVYIPKEKRDKHFPARYMVSLKTMPGVKLQC